MGLSILVVGAGAVGGYFGGRLTEAGRDVTFLVRPNRAKQLARDGLRIISPHGDATISPKLILANQIKAAYQLILLGVKAYALQAAMTDFARAVGPETIILPVLNGMRHLDLLVKRFGEDPVIGGVCLIVAELDNNTRIVQSADIQRLVYGERNGETTPCMRALDATLRGAGFDAQLSTNIIEEMWQKWVQLASLGATTCLLDGAIGEIVAVPGGADLARRILDECVTIAGVCGYPPSERFVSRHLATVTAMKSPLTSSMYRDFRRGAQVEADHILGDLIERGAAHGVEAPLLSAALAKLQVYQNRLSNH